MNKNVVLPVSWLSVDTVLFIPLAAGIISGLIPIFDPGVLHSATCADVRSKH